MSRICRSICEEDRFMERTLKRYPAEMPWAIIQAKNQAFAVATQDLREMVMMPEVAAVPEVPDYVRGVINLRGRVIPLLDLRKRMGLSSALEEVESFCALMEQREQDHRKWLNELEASVKEQRPFTLATDPHKCAFGKWYDAYHADNIWVGGLLKRFDAPHQEIHSIAIQVENLKAKGAPEEAQQLVQKTREGALAKMLQLFADLRSLAREAGREIAVVLQNDSKLFAISIDSAESIEKLQPGSIEEMAAAIHIADHGVVKRLGKRAKSGEVVLLIETDRLMSAGDIDAMTKVPAA
jgi:chemotaxis signal transduction protein